VKVLCSPKLWKAKKEVNRNSQGYPNHTRRETKKSVKRKCWVQRKKLNKSRNITKAPRALKSEKLGGNQPMGHSNPH